MIIWQSCRLIPQLINVYGTFYSSPSILFPFTLNSGFPLSPKQNNFYAPPVSSLTTISKNPRNPAEFNVSIIEYLSSSGSLKFGQKILCSTVTPDFYKLLSPLFALSIFSLRRCPSNSQKKQWSIGCTSSASCVC